jgi:hypothetical protein
MSPQHPEDEAMTNEEMTRHLAEAMQQLGLAGVAADELFEGPVEEMGTQHNLAEESIAKAYRAVQAVFRALGGTEKQFKEFSLQEHERFIRETEQAAEYLREVRHGKPLD